MDGVLTLYGEVLARLLQIPVPEAVLALTRRRALLALTRRRALPAPSLVSGRVTTVLGVAVTVTAVHITDDDQAVRRQARLPCGPGRRAPP
jgi:hypothetical protein